MVGVIEGKGIQIHSIAGDAYRRTQKPTQVNGITDLAELLQQGGKNFTNGKLNVRL